MTKKTLWFCEYVSSHKVFVAGKPFNLMCACQGQTAFKDTGKINSSVSGEKRKKEAPSLPLICASVGRARSNPGWNVSGR